MRILVSTLLCLTLLGCASGGTYNPTTFKAQYDERVLDRKQYSTLVIANINLGKPSRNYLEEHEQRVDARVQEYLEAQGFHFVPQSVFDEAFQQGVYKYGEPYDRDTGRVNDRSYVAALNEAAGILRERGDIDAILFTDLIETQEFFSAGLTHIARFNGVTRKPSMQGTGDGVPVDFNWAQQIDAVSLYVNLYDLELKRLFQGIGGIELTEALDNKGGTVRFARRRKVLDDNGDIDEGIRLAFHPLVQMKGWPGSKK